MCRQTRLPAQVAQLRLAHLGFRFSKCVKIETIVTVKMALPKMIRSRSFQLSNSLFAQFVFVLAKDSVNCVGQKSDPSPYLNY